MIFFRRIVWMQTLWLLLALSYNLTSWWRIEHYQSALSPTNPAAAFFIVAAITIPVIWLGLTGNTRRYFQMNLLLIIIIGNATYTHLIAYSVGTDLSSYASTTSWALAFSINFFGATAGILGAWQSFH
ncbi:MAG: hypothetical protein AB8B81_08070 [Halioglobus sp.]